VSVLCEILDVITTHQDKKDDLLVWKNTRQHPFY